MNTPHTHQDYPIQLVGYHTRSLPQTRRRRLLGLILIVVGSDWLWLRLIGWVGDLPLLLDSANLPFVTSRLPDCNELRYVVTVLIG